MVAGECLLTLAEPVRSGSCGMSSRQNTLHGMQVDTYATPVCDGLRVHAHVRACVMACGSVRECVFVCDSVRVCVCVCDGLHVLAHMCVRV